MKTLKNTFKLLGLSLAYFFIISFIIFIANLLLEKFIWPFVEGNIALYIAHNAICLIALLFGVMLVAPAFRKELNDVNHKTFIAASTAWMIAFVVISDYYLLEEIGKSEFYVQIVNSFLIIIFFALLSYNYIVKELKTKKIED